MLAQNRGFFAKARAPRSKISGQSATRYATVEPHSKSLDLREMSIYRCGRMTELSQSTTSTNPLAETAPWNWGAESYLEIAMPFLALFGERAIECAALQRSMTVLDVATGPGTLACRMAPLVARVDAIDFSEAMVTHCKQRVSQLGLTNVHTQLADGQNLPFATATFDATFSMFGLMFFPDRVRGFREMHRVLKPGGRTFVTSWAPIDDSPLMLARVAAQQFANPNVPPPQRNLMTLEDPEVFLKEMSNSGFVDVRVEPVTRDYQFRDFEHLFAGITRGSAPIELLKRNVGEAEWERQLSRMREHLSQTYRTFPLSLSSKAWLGSGQKR